MKSYIRAGFALSLLAAASISFAQTYQKQKIRIAHFLPVTFAGVDVDKWFADEIKKRSGGAIDTEVYWAGAMGSSDELLRLVQTGAVEIAGFPFSYYGKQFPLSHIGSIPNVFASVDDAYEKFLKIAALPEIQDEHKKSGVVMLTSHFSNPYRLACNKTTATLDGMKGYKARSVGEYMPAVYKTFGMVPVNSPSNEVYEALDRKVLDCTYLSYDQMVASKIHEVAKFASDINLGAYATWQLWGNEKWLSSLAPANKKLILEVAAEANALDVKKAKEAAAEAPKQLEARGVTIQKLSPVGDYEKRVPSAVKIWEANMKRQGLEQAATKVMGVIGAK